MPLRGTSPGGGSGFSDPQACAAHVGVIGCLDPLGVQPPGEIVLHELVEELDILRDRAGQLLGRAVAVGRAEAADELAVVESVADLHARRRGEVQILDALPEAEEVRHRADQRRALGAEDDAQLADRILAAAIQLDLVLDGRAVLVLQRAFQRHRQAVGREEGHQLPRGGHELFDGAEHVVDAPLGRGVVHVLGQNLVDEVRAVGAQRVSQGVDLPHDLVVEHQAVECFFHGKHRPFISVLSIAPKKLLSRLIYKFNCKLYMNKSVNRHLIFQRSFGIMS